MVPVKSFMVPKEKFVTVERDTDARTAARVMRDGNIGSLFVTNGKDVIGIITDTDMVRRVVAAGADPAKTTVEQIMSAPIVTIEENKTLLDANAASVDPFPEPPEGVIRGRYIVCVYDKANPRQYLFPVWMQLADVKSVNELLAGKEAARDVVLQLETDSIATAIDQAKKLERATTRAATNPAE